MKKEKLNRVSLLWILAVLFLFPVRVAISQDTPEAQGKVEQTVPKSELENLKAEWEAVREQQVQMILEKEDQLEKLKEEIFSMIKILNGPAGGGGSPELEAQKEVFQVERQKFFVEMSLQKENLHKLQADLDEKAKQLEADRARFEQEKKTALR